MLLHKRQGKPHNIPSSYRPLSQLDGAGKLFERMLLRRLEEYAEKSLSKRQFGFRRGRSTTDAIAEVLKIEHWSSAEQRAMCSGHARREECLQLGSVETD